jgi:hypothetical protein
MRFSGTSNRRLASPIAQQRSPQLDWVVPLSLLLFIIGLLALLIGLLRE